MLRSTGLAAGTLCPRPAGPICCWLHVDGAWYALLLDGTAVLCRRGDSPLRLAQWRPSGWLVRLAPLGSEPGRRAEAVCVNPPAWLPRSPGQAEAGLVRVKGAGARLRRDGPGQV